MSSPIHATIGIIKHLNALASRNDLGSQTVLTFLAVAESGSAGIPQTQLERRTGLSGAGVSRNITRLGNGSPGNPGLGLVVSHEDPANRRYKIVSLTDKGRALINADPR